MNKEEVQAMFKRSKANAETLAKCPEHEFFELDTGELETSGIPYSPKKTGKRYECYYCGGQLNSINVSWYNKGLEHGGKIPLNPL